MAEIIDLSAPQRDGFRSIVDLRGLANVQPHEATPIAPAAVRVAAPMPVRAAASPAAQAAEPQPSQAQSKPARVVYVGYGVSSHAERPAKPRRSFRFGRRR
ncbi:MAG: hypothetical protein R3D69_16790 [Xanthobacteraceae bacterium]